MRHEKGPKKPVKTRSEWRELCRHYRDTGEDADVFASMYNISVPSLRRWTSEFRREEKEEELRHKLAVVASGSTPNVQMSYTSKDGSKIDITGTYSAQEMATIVRAIAAGSACGGEAVG